MIKFERYPHTNDMFQHYINKIGNDLISKIMDSGVTSKSDTTKLSEFVWRMVEKIHHDEKKGYSVSASTDNIAMLPDLSYEITKYTPRGQVFGFYIELFFVESKALKWTHSKLRNHQKKRPIENRKTDRTEYNIKKTDLYSTWEKVPEANM